MSTYTQTQAHPPPAVLGRKNSFFGAIKNIVTAPLSWFGGSEGDFGDSDARGKRRRLPIASEQTRDDSDSDSEQRTKRMRMGSPNRDKQPYLDPPRSAFRQHHKISEGARIRNHRHVSPSPRKALRVPDATPRNRRTMSPYPSGSQLKAQPSVRTMSLDPPSGLGYSGSPARLQPVPTMQDLTEEKDAMSISREPSMSNLRMRTSVTPQPSGADFGPVIPPRRERDPTEPPPLMTLMSNPMFVKPPLGLQKTSTAEMTRQATLGSLLDSQRKQTHSPVRRGSVLFGTGSMTDISAPHLWPINPAEKALHELEVYKTPLLPSRLKGAPIPDTFISKKSRPITLMHDRDRERKKGKGKNKLKDRDGINGTKPYAGEGGMKKWLARRKREEEAVRAYEEADREKEKEQAMEEDGSAEAEAEKLSEQQKKAQAEEAQRKKQMEVAAVPKTPAFEPKLGATREMSSLRVGRSRMRNHIERPSAKRTNKFSAAFEDDEDVMDDERAALEEAAKKAPVFEIPAGFTFAKETSIPHDATGAKEPPISALPFSLSKPTAPVAKPVSAPEPSAALAPAVPTISFVHPTPQPPKSDACTEPAPVTAALPTSASNIPNFFANTAAYTKPLAVTTHSGSFGAPPPVLAPTPAPRQVPEASKATEASTSLFGTPVTALQASVTPSAAPAATLIFGAAPASASTSVFGPSSTSTGTSLDVLAAPKAAPAAIEVAPVASPVISPPPTYASTPAPSSSPFSFSASTAPAEIAPANEAPKPAEREASKPPSLFGATPSATPFGFGTPAVSAPAVEPSKPGFSFGERAPTPAMTEPSKSAFSFGGPTPSTTPAPVPAPVIEVPKPFFGKQDTSLAARFPFGPRPSTAPAEEKPAVVLPPFSFASASPAPAEKKPFAFGAPSPAPPTATAKPFSFGHANAGSNATDASKPFNFGQSAPAPAPARPATPPKADQEISMDESPSRDMNTNGKAPERPTLDFSSFTGASSTPAGSTLFAQSPATATGPGFGFGTASVNPFAKQEDKEKPGMAFGSGNFGQPSGSGFGFGQGATETPAPASAALFSFSQAASPNVAPTPGFGFSQTTSNAFGQQQSTSSAPSSPSTFNRPGTSFSFGTPASTQPAAPSFTFGGSQPASPATPAGGLPQPSGGAFAFGQSGAAPAATPNSFAPTAAPSSGGALFTIGAAPQPDGRQIKKLPRRGVGRR